MKTFFESNLQAKDYIDSKLKEIDTKYHGETNMPMTSTDHDHNHGYEVDDKGRGRTTTTYPEDFHSSHIHEIMEWKVMPSGKDSHRHTIYDALSRVK